MTDEEVKGVVDNTAFDAQLLILIADWKVKPENKQFRKAINRVEDALLEFKSDLMTGNY